MLLLRFVHGKVSCLSTSEVHIRNLDAMKLLLVAPWDPFMTFF